MASRICPVAMWFLYTPGRYNRGRCDREQARIVSFIDDRFVVERNAGEWSAFVSIQAVYNVCMRACHFGGGNCYGGTLE